ncbi:MAG: CxxC-x17-CxxC domain-containing protein, partial [Nitrosopumilaceae archaeon]
MIKSMSEDRQMHPATYADCKKETQVPFKPTEGRPVY